MSKKNEHGFTLFEFLLATAILIVVFAASFPLYSNLQWSAQITETHDELVSTLRLAHIRSVTRMNDSAHGVYFDINASGPDRYVIFQGSSYATRVTAYDRSVTLSSAIELALSLSGGSQEIVFSKNAGLPSAFGNITVTHTPSNEQRIITINAYGTISGQ